MSAAHREENLEVPPAHRVELATQPLAEAADTRRKERDRIVTHAILEDV
jgi:hypothetical protein